jgi:hypothetical protein
LEKNTSQNEGAYRGVRIFAEDHTIAAVVGIGSIIHPLQANIDKASARSQREEIPGERKGGRLYYLAGDSGVVPTLTMEKTMVFFKYCYHVTIKCKTQRIAGCVTTIIKIKIKNLSIFFMLRRLLCKWKIYSIYVTVEDIMHFTETG